MSQDDDTVDVTKERTQADADGPGDSKGNEEGWCKDISSFEQIMGSLEQDAKVFPDLTPEDTNVGFLVCVYQKNLGNYKGPNESVCRVGAYKMIQRAGG